MNKNKIILFIGAPGSGKGTQCKLLAEKTGMMHLSTGDLCREAVRLDTDLGRTVKQYIDNRVLVPDKVMIEVVNEYLKLDEVRDRGILLDGYPRTLKQAWSLLQNKDVEIDRVILMQVSDNLCKERILGRRVDPVTAETFNVVFPECMCSDEDIAQRLVRRGNDSDGHNIDVRLSFFQMNLGQILKCFQGKIFPVNGGRSVHDVYEEVLRAVDAPILEVTEIVQKKKPAENAEQLCAVCYVEPANFLVIPCGHQCGCQSCLNTIMSNTAYAQCPICRTDMTKIVQVFRSGIDKEFDEVVEQAVGVVELEEQYHFEEDDGGWGAFDDLSNQNSKISNFESSISDNITVSINPCDDLDEGARSNVDIAVTLNPPDIGIDNRVPVDICCVIDVSGSMKTAATYQDPNDDSRTIDDGFTILDIVKHAVKTVIHSLTENDRLSIVIFNAEAKEVFTLCEMNNGGKEEAIHILEKLAPKGKTNIWAGLEIGLNSLFNANELLTVTHISRKKNIFLLTDGQPVISPPDGEVVALQEYLETYPDMTTQIHTFGFGYSLSSDLLLDLAIHGNGTYAFIPDAKIIGTCFVNAVANACSTLCQQAKIHLIPQGDASFAGEISGDIPFDEASWGRIAQLGPLQYGQPRDIVVPMNIPSSLNSTQYLKVIVEYENSKPGQESHKVIAFGSSRLTSPDSITAYIRNHAVHTSFGVSSSLSNGQGQQGVRMMKGLIGKMTSYQSLHQDPRITGLFQDVDGRMKKSLSTVERWNRWGKHYLRAITRSHQLQVRTNFMDPGLQLYGGTLFTSLMELGGKIFLTLPLMRYDNPRNQSSQIKATPAKKGKNYNRNQRKKNRKKDNQGKNNERKQNPNQGKPSYTQTYVSNTQANTPEPAPKTAPEPEPDYNDTYYGGACGGCFDASATVIVYSEGKTYRKNVSEVKRNDQLQVVDAQGNIKKAVVEYAVEIKLENTHSMVKFNDTGLILTKKHPVKFEGRWQAPKDLVNNETIISCSGTTNSVFNFVLSEKRVGLMVNNIECVTFGHNIKEAWHQFYASQEAIKTVASLADNQGKATVLGSLSLYK